MSAQVADSRAARKAAILELAKFLWDVVLSRLDWQPSDRDACRALVALTEAGLFPLLNKVVSFIGKAQQPRPEHGALVYAAECNAVRLAAVVAKRYKVDLRGCCLYAALRRAAQTFKSKAFLAWLSAARQPEDITVTSALLVSACQSENGEVVQYLASQYSFGMQGKKKALQAVIRACEVGNLAGLKNLSTTFDLVATTGFREKRALAFAQACGHGHLEVAKYLDELCALTWEEAWTEEGLAFRMAARDGHLGVLRWLLEEFALEGSFADRVADLALRAAIENGRDETADWLFLQFGVPKERHANQMLTCALALGDLERAKRLAGGCPGARPIGTRLPEILWSNTCSGRTDVLEWLSRSFPRCFECSGLQDWDWERAFISCIPRHVETARFVARLFALAPEKCRALCAEEGLFNDGRLSAQDRRDFLPYAAASRVAAAFGVTKEDVLAHPYPIWSSFFEERAEWYFTHFAITRDDVLRAGSGTLDAFTRIAYPSRCLEWLLKRFGIHRSEMKPLAARALVRYLEERNGDWPGAYDQERCGEVSSWFVDSFGLVLGDLRFDDDVLVRRWCELRCEWGIRWLLETFPLSSEVAAAWLRILKEVRCRTPFFDEFESKLSASSS